MTRAIHTWAAEELTGPGLHALLEQSFERRWRRYRKVLKRCAKEFSEGSVHELRVETRRWLAWLGLLEPFLGEVPVQALAGRVKKLFKSSARLRDVQVQLPRLELKFEEFPKLAPLRKYLMRREKRLSRRLDRKIAGAVGDSLRKQVAGMRKVLRLWTRDAPLEGRHATQLLRSVNHAYDRVLAMRRAVRPELPETIHRVRVAFKRFRYMVEMLQPILPSIPLERLDAMHAFQQKMGEIQDVEVLLATLDKYTKKEPASALDRFHQDLLGHRADLIAGFLQGPDPLPEFWP